jgi:hypothetical protein
LALAGDPHAESPSAAEANAEREGLEAAVEAAVEAVVRIFSALAMDALDPPLLPHRLL